MRKSFLSPRNSRTHPKRSPKKAAVRGVRPNTSGSKRLRRRREKKDNEPQHWALINEAEALQELAMKRATACFFPTEWSYESNHARRSAHESPPRSQSPYMTPSSPSDRSTVGTSPRTRSAGVVRTSSGGRGGFSPGRTRNLRLQGSASRARAQPGAAHTSMTTRRARGLRIEERRVSEGLRKCYLEFISHLSLLDPKSAVLIMEDAVSVILILSISSFYF